MIFQSAAVVLSIFGFGLTLWADVMNTNINLDKVKNRSIKKRIEYEISSFTKKCKIHCAILAALCVFILITGYLHLPFVTNVIYNIVLFTYLFYRLIWALYCGNDRIKFNNDLKAEINKELSRNEK